MSNASFTQGRFSDRHKHAIVRPRLKKPSLDPIDITSYILTSNLLFVSKTAERLVVNRLAVHANQYSLLPVRQSAYRQYHSTETAIISVHNDIVRATDAGLVLLDLSSAFDTVDHEILIDVLRDRFGIEQHEQEWFRSYHIARRHSRRQITALTSQSDV